MPSAAIFALVYNKVSASFFGNRVQNSSLTDFTDLSYIVDIIINTIIILRIKQNGCMDDLRFYILINSISVISGRWADVNERMYAMEPRLRLRQFRHECQE